jgi:hypothetical protein
MIRKVVAKFHKLVRQKKIRGIGRYDLNARDKSLLDFDVHDETYTRLIGRVSFSS